MWFDNRVDDIAPQQHRIIIELNTLPSPKEIEVPDVDLLTNNDLSTTPEGAAMSYPRAFSNGQTLTIENRHSDPDILPNPIPKAPAVDQQLQPGWPQGDQRQN
jgi:hypothetical protein